MPQKKKTENSQPKSKPSAPTKAAPVKAAPPKAAPAKAVPAKATPAKPTHPAGKPTNPFLVRNPPTKRMNGR